MGENRIKVTAKAIIDGRTVEISKVYHPDTLDWATADTIVEDIFDLLEKTYEMDPEKESKER